MFKMRVNDCTSGLRCYSLGYVKNVIGDLHSQTYDIQIETVKQAQSQGFAVKEIPITFLTDEHGLTGRECPSCNGYFKVKFGTGMPTSHCICPYCGEKSDHNQFFTQDQIKYAQSVAVREGLGPELKKLERSFKFQSAYSPTNSI